LETVLSTAFVLVHPDYNQRFTICVVEASCLWGLLPSFFSSGRMREVP
jgi:hypothetical protein